MYSDAHFVQVILFILDKLVFVNNPALFLSITNFFFMGMLMVLIGTDHIQCLMKLIANIKLGGYFS